jgi:hypothetical protein
MRGWTDSSPPSNGAVTGRRNSVSDNFFGDYDPANIQRTAAFKKAVERARKRETVTGELTTKIVKKTYEQLRSIRREYMMFTSAEGALRAVVHPLTKERMTAEFWYEICQRGPGVHSGYFIESVDYPADGEMQRDSRIFGIKVMTDESVPEGEVELRAVLAKSWEPVE